jgi:hypothetical protein
MKYWHKRVDIRGLSELGPLQQAYAVCDKGEEEANSETYVVVSKWGDDVDQFWYLSDFMRTGEGSRYDGVMGVCTTAAIGIILSRDNEQGVIQCFG